VPNFVDSPSIKVEFVLCVHRTLKFSTMNLNEYCKDKDLAACALKLEFLFNRMCIITINNTDNHELMLTVEDLGFSDHLAQILRINGGIDNMRSKAVTRR
jgi:hypothetical protein